ncbi:MAG: cytochrome-c peroxidase [Burkholderiales bacterium]
MNISRFAVLLAVLGVGSGAGADEPLRRQAAALFGAIGASTAAASPEAELGRALFWDTRLSLDGKTACASCHSARDWGADRRTFSPDARGALTSRHSPTVFNSTAQPMLRWLGDRKNAAEQAEGSIGGSMGFPSREAAVAKMNELKYAPAFRAAFPQDAEPVSAKNYGRALAAYQATLTTPAAFDRFLAGDDGALTERQQTGLRTFIVTGCAYCHNGPNVGGTALQKFGPAKAYWLETGSKKIDQGRFSITKKEEDRYVFRVPTLRNVAKTAPYFHDGSVDRLDHAVRAMANVQLGHPLDDAAVTDIVSFLEALTGEVPSNYAPPGQKPAL